MTFAKAKAVKGFAGRKNNPQKTKSYGMAKNQMNREAQKEFAFALYMNNEPQAVIAEKTGVSRQTISKWINDNGWAERRAAKTISRPELANKILKSIADEIDRLNEPEDTGGITAAAIDKLTKMAAMVEKLDKKAGVVETIEVFIAFGKWLQYQSTFDPELTPELVRAINNYQNKYIAYIMGERAA